MKVDGMTIALSAVAGDEHAQLGSQELVEKLLESQIVRAELKRIA
jgi:hypothetical protein